MDNHDNDGISPHNAGQAGTPRTDKPNEYQISDERTPLLSNGSQGSERDGASKPLEWEGAADFVNLPWYKTPSMYWLLPNFFLFAIAFGGIIVPKLNLILTLVCRQYFFDRSQIDHHFVFTPVRLGADNEQCRDPQVQKLVSKFTLILTVTVGAFSAIMAPKFGALSDRYGRKTFMILSSGGLFMTEVITILVYRFPDRFHYNWLLAGAVLDGLCGSFTVGMALTNAYATDCTPPPKRAVAFGYFHACLFSGIALGPFIAARLIKAFGDLIVIFYASIAVHTFYIIFIALVVPESLTKKRQLMARERHAAEEEVKRRSRTGGSRMKTLRKMNILEPLKILWPTGPGTSPSLRANLILLASVDTIIFGVAMGAMSVLVYYLGYRFDWDTVDTSYFMSTVNSARTFGLVVCLPALNYFIRTRRINRQRREFGFVIPERNSGTDILDLTVIRFCIFLEIVGYFGYSIVATGKLFTAFGVVAAFGGIGSPTLQSALTKHVPHGKVGQLLGATGLLHALARIVSPIFFNLLYASTVDTFPQAMFVVLTGCFGVAFINSWFIKPHVYLEDLSPAIEDTTQTNETINNAVIDDEFVGF